MSFRLESFYIKQREKTLYELNFYNKDYLYNANQPFTSLIIGENGVGKSYVLRIIAEIFKFASEFQNNQKKIINFRYDFYKLSYKLYESNYSIIIDNKEMKVYKENVKIDLKDLLLPNKVLAVSFMINDKFTFSSSNLNDTFQYLGIRRTSNAAWTSSIMKKISEQIIRNLESEKFLNQLLHIFKFLEFKPEILFEFRLKRKSLLNKKISKNDIAARFKSVSKSKMLLFSEFYKYDNEIIKEIQTFINKKIDTSKNELSFEYKINLENPSLDITNEYKILKYLIAFEWINIPDFWINKIDYFSFLDASSGEKHYLSTMVGIASCIENNSIVLIDEPELSLHPVWQVNYISKLKEIFNSYDNCHFILSTHSHFLVADIDKNSSSIIKMYLSKCENEITREAVLINENTYNWSSENILYNVFQMKSTRNHFFEIELRRLLDLISNKKHEYNEIRNLKNKLSNYVFDDSDPLKLIIDEAERYLENDKKN